MLISTLLPYAGLYLLQRTQHSQRRRLGLAPLAKSRQALFRCTAGLCVFSALPLTANVTGWPLGTLYWIAATGLLGILLVLLEAARVHWNQRKTENYAQIPAANS